MIRYTRGNLLEAKTESLIEGMKHWPGGIGNQEILQARNGTSICTGLMTPYVLIPRLSFWPH